MLIEAHTIHTSIVCANTRYYTILPPHLRNKHKCIHYAMEYDWVSLQWNMIGYKWMRHSEEQELLGIAYDWWCLGMWRFDCESYTVMLNNETRTSRFRIKRYLNHLPVHQRLEKQRREGRAGGETVPLFYTPILGCYYLFLYSYILAGVET